jgi:hypothetical protein
VLATREPFVEPRSRAASATGGRVSDRPEPRSARPRPALAALTAFALVIAVLLILSSLLRGPGTAPGAGATRTATAATTVRRTASPAPTAPPSPAADPAAAAIDAVGRLEGAINAATGGKDGLKGKEANDLTRRAEAVRAALLGGDFSSAAALASDLQDRIDEIDGDRGQPLQDAVAALVDAIPG